MSALSSVPAAAEPAAPASAPAHLRLPGLTVVLPCFDEEPNVAEAVAQALAAATRHASAVEVIVVDDGSRDGTRGVAELIAAQDRRVRVVGHEVNRGYGAAVRSGITASRMPWVLLTDADLQFDLQELGSMLPVADDHDLVAGYRIDRQDPLHRRLAADCWNRLMRRTFGVAVRDVDCAFKLVRGEAVRALELQSEGAMISTELYACAERAGWRITEVGVHHRPRTAGEPSGGNPAVVLRAFRERRVLARQLEAAAAAAAAATAPEVRGAPRPLPVPQSQAAGS
jgi:glycosyltransferase involved in cell wall biosynthesis